MSEITLRFASILEVQQMIEHHRREGEERERRAIVRWLRWQAESRVSFAPAELANILERNEHDDDWVAALKHAGIDKDDA